MLRLCPLPVTAARVLLLGRLPALRVPPRHGSSLSPFGCPRSCTSFDACDAPGVPGLNPAGGLVRRHAGGLAHRLASGLVRGGLARGGHIGGGLVFVLARLPSGPTAPPDDSLSG